MTSTTAAHRVALWIAALVLGCAASGCDDTREPSESSASSPPLSADWAKLGGHDYVYLQVNTDGASHYELFRADTRSGALDQLTDIPGPFGVSNFSVSRAGVTIGDAEDGSDQAVTLRADGARERMPGPRLLGPTINDRGDVVAYRPLPHGISLVLRRAGQTRWTTLARHFGGQRDAIWLTNDSLALIRSGARATTWAEATLDGHRSRSRRIAPRGYLPQTYGYHPGLVLLGGAHGRPMLLWRPGQAPTALPSGWRRGCLSPDDSRVLLIGPRGIGVMPLDVAHPKIEILGEDGSGVLVCAWTDERAGPQP